MGRRTGPILALAALLVAGPTPSSPAVDGGASSAQKKQKKQKKRKRKARRRHQHRHPPPGEPEGLIESRPTLRVLGGVGVHPSTTWLFEIVGGWNIPAGSSGAYWKPELGYTSAGGDDGLVAGVGPGLVLTGWSIAWAPRFVAVDSGNGVRNSLVLGLGQDTLTVELGHQFVGRPSDPHEVRLVAGLDLVVVGTVLLWGAFGH